MTAWPIRKVGEVVEFLNARRVPVKAADRAKRQGIFPYYGASGVVDWIDDFIFDGRYLLVSEDGENLKSRKAPIAFTVTGRFWVNNHAHILDERETGIIDYLSRALNRTHLSAYITGAAEPKLNKRTLEQVSLPIPPAADRVQINAILNALDDKIEVNRRMAGTLEAMARALYRSWFVDFDPVHSKAEGCAPAHMDPATADLFPARFRDDGLPQGWEMATISEVCEHIKHTVKPQDQPAAPFQHFSLPAFDKGAGPERVLGAEIKSNKMDVPDDAILFSRLNPSIPRIWWARVDAAFGAPAASTEFFVARAGSDLETPWLYALLGSSGLRDEAISRVTGTSNSHQRVPPSAFAGIEVTHPSESIREAFGTIALPWFRRSQAAADENRTLAALRDTLLPKLMSGELRVAEAAARVAEAV